MATAADSSYVNFPLLLDPDFSPTAYANTLILATNNSSDTTLDLSTPLKRVLFDAQEVDTHIDTLTTQNAEEIVLVTNKKAVASTAVLEAVETQVATLKESYDRLQREVIERWETAEQVRAVAERLVGALRLGRKVLRCLQLGRQLEGLVEEGRMVGAAETIVGLKSIFQDDDKQLERVKTVTSLKTDLVGPAERIILSRAQTVVKEFSMSGLLAANSLQQQQQQQQQNTALHTGSSQHTQTFARTEETKSRASNAIHTLYVLSLIPPRNSTKSMNAPFEPTLLLSALTAYLQTCLSSSTASLTRSLANLPTLDRTLLEISARCQNLVALEALLAGLRPPNVAHLLFQAPPHGQLHNGDGQADENLLAPLLRHLDTASLPSYFWRSVAGSAAPRVQEILSKGGSTARTLRASRERLRESLRECVDRGSRLPGSTAGNEANGSSARRGSVANWEREAAVMVGSVVGPLGR